MNNRERLNGFNGIKEFACLNSHITILDNTIAVIENCKKIIECNEILAKVLTGKFEVEVWGTDLSLSNFCSDCVEVRGKINSVNLIPKKAKE